MLHLIIGGSGSGKSEYAEKLMMREPEGKRIYLATMKPWDEECRQKIERHRIMRRGKGFATMECYGRLDSLAIPQGSSVLLECLGNLTANLFYSQEAEGEDMAQILTNDILDLQKRTKTLMIVTNDIFSDGLFYGVETEAYRAVLGQVNKSLAKEADQVTEVVYGIPVLIQKEKT